MNDLAFLANEHVHSLPVEQQLDILWQYVHYVEETVIHQVGDPFLFLKWYLLTQYEPAEEAEKEQGNGKE